MKLFYSIFNSDKDHRSVSGEQKCKRLRFFSFSEIGREFYLFIIAFVLT